MSRSSGKMLVRNPTRKISDATKSDDRSDWVFFATKSLTVQTSMMTTKARMGFIERSSSMAGTGSLQATVPAGA